MQVTKQEWLDIVDEETQELPTELRDKIWDLAKKIEVERSKQNE